MMINHFCPSVTSCSAILQPSFVTHLVTYLQIYQKNVNSRYQCQSTSYSVFYVKTKEILKISEKGIEWKIVYSG